MAYVVIARKWRPTTFTDVIAQQHISQTLENAIESGRISHAYLFSGPRGIGKTSMARIFAKALNCEKGPTKTPCNTCSNCTEITGGRSLDVVEIDGASNRGIDEVRSLRENVRYMPVQGKSKIYIIDEVHMLTKEAFNALLKTLEEPPEHVVFIFATTEPHKLPATILSRCQRFDFRLIPLEEIQKQLAMICESEKISIDEESLFLIAKRGDGSMRDAQSFLDQITSFCGNSISKEQVQTVFGLVNQDLLFQISEAILRKSTKDGVTIAGEIIAAGYDLKEFFASLIEHLRNLLVVGITGDTALVESTDATRKQYGDLASSFSEEDILRLLSIATEAFYSIKKGGSPQINLELTLIKMIKMEQSVRISDIVERLEGITGSSGRPVSDQASSLRKKSFDKQSQKASTSGPRKLENHSSGEKTEILFNASDQSFDRSQSQGSDSADLEEIRQKWNDILEMVKKSKPDLAAVLQTSRLTALNGNNLEITFPNHSESNAPYINAIKNQPYIQDTISAVMKKTIQVTLQLDVSKTESTESTESPANQSNEDILKSAEESNPIIGEIVNMFDAQIVDYQKEPKSTSTREESNE